MDSSDRILLDRYLTGRDEEAFRTLVGRYLNFVHAVALRVTANEDMARDVAQSAFIRLARRASLIPPDVTLAAWLHRSTHSLAVDQVRAEASRKKRELASTLLPDPMDKAQLEPDWSVLAPVVDELVNHLPAADRDLLLLRYYRNESHATIAARLGLTESVARKRAFRAVEKLRALLGKRGIPTTAAALATLLPVHASPSAPAVLAASVAQAVQGIAPAVPSFVQSLLLTMTTSQKTAFAGSVLLLLAASGYSLSPDPNLAYRGRSALTAASLGIDPRTARPDGVRFRTPRAVPVDAGERMERLKTIMSITSNAGRHVELIAFLDELPPALFEETMRFLIAHGGDQEAVMLAASAWAKADLPAALACAAAQSEYGISAGMDRQILKDWEILDPQAALDWASTKSTNPFGIADEMLNRLAKKSPDEIAGLIRNMPLSDQKGRAFELLVNAMKEDPALLRRILAGATESQRAVIYGELASSQADSGEGIAILQQHPEAAPYATPSFLYMMWACRDMDAASAAVAGMPPGPPRQEAAEGLIIQAAKTAPEKIPELLDLYPGFVTPDRMGSLVKDIAATDPALALSQTTRISDPDERNAVVVARLKDWRKNDPGAAGAWLESNPQPPAVLKKLSSEN